MIDTIYPTMRVEPVGLLSRWRGAAAIGNGHGGGALLPYDVYPTSDGYVAIIVVTPQHWRSLCEAMERPELADDERFRSNGRRYRHRRRDELNHHALGRAALSWGCRKCVAGSKVPAAAVRDVGEVVEDRHLHERGALQHVDHPQLGEVVVPHSPLRFRETPLAPLMPSPALGADNEVIYGGWLGLDTDEIERLRKDGVI